MRSGKAASEPAAEAMQQAGGHTLDQRFERSLDWFGSPLPLAGEVAALAECGGWGPTLKIARCSQ